MAILSISIGEKYGTGTVYNLTDVKLDVTEVYRFVNAPIFENNVLKWGIESIYTNVLECIRQAQVQGFDIDSLTINSWGMDYSYIDSNGNILNNPVHFKDIRTNEIYRKFPSLSLKDLYTKSGISYNQSNTVFQLADDSLSYNYENIVSFIYIADVMNYMLTGIVSTDKTLASTSGFFNDVDGFLTSFIASLGIPENIVPLVEKDIKSLGFLKPFLLQNLNLKNDVKVITGCGYSDAAAFLCFKKGSPVIITGSYNKIGRVIDEPIISQQGFSASFSNETGLDGYNFTKRTAGTHIIDECRNEWARMGKYYDDSMIDTMTKSVTPYSYLFDITSKIFSAYNTMPQKVMAVSGARTDAEIIRAAYDSAMFENKFVLSELEYFSNKKFQKIYVAGSLSQNVQYCKDLANVLGIKVVSYPFDPASMGGAIIQYIEQNKFPDFGFAADFIKSKFRERVFEPEEDRTKVETAYKNYLMKKKGR